MSCHRYRRASSWFRLQSLLTVKYGKANTSNYQQQTAIYKPIYVYAWQINLLRHVTLMRPNDKGQTWPSSSGYSD